MIIFRSAERKNLIIFYFPAFLEFLLFPLLLPLIVELHTA
jgi:hypothetical protein